MFAAMPEVDRVLGNAEKLRADAWKRRAAWRSAFGERARRSPSSDIMAVRGDGAASRRRLSSGLPRAFVQVQNGCDHRCTFCIIPYGRGNSRSVPMGAVVDAGARAGRERAMREIVLTGVDITSYGADLPGAPRLGALVKQILKHVPELQRLRLSSIDSIEADAI